MASWRVEPPSHQLLLLIHCHSFLSSLFSFNMHQRYCAEISTTTSLSTQKSPVPLPSMQPSISASLQNADIRKSNNATVEMAIADFFTAKILLMLLLSRQGLPGLYVCAALLVMILFCQITNKLGENYLTLITNLPIRPTRICS